jgi:hypothetical protein
MAVVIVTMVGGRSMPVIVVAVTCAVTVIVVRLVLVAHCYSVPQPLFAVFAAKSV